MTETIGGNAREKLKGLVERIERLEEEKKTISEDIKEVYGEVKGEGFDAKILKRVIALRKKDPDVRFEEEAIFETYLGALGMLTESVSEETLSNVEDES